MDERERERLSELLTPEEMSDPAKVEGARKRLAKSDLAALEHEVAHRTVAKILGARYEQTSVGEGDIEGTAFQVSVTCAAGPEWDRMNDRYLRTSELDEAGIRAGEESGYDREFLSLVARKILGLASEDIRQEARETLPPGAIRDIR